jgi:hypothetical protein
MEVLNNVQLEGRRINVEISQNDGGEDVITTEEVLGGRFWWREVLLKKRVFYQREGLVGGRSLKLRSIEIEFGGRSSAEKEVLAEEVQLKRRFHGQTQGNERLLDQETRKCDTVNFLVII